MPWMWSVFLGFFRNQSNAKGSAFSKSLKLEVVFICPALKQRVFTFRTLDVSGGCLLVLPNTVSEFKANLYRQNHFHQADGFISGSFIA